LNNHFIIKYRFLIIIGFVAISAFFASQIPKGELDTEIKHMLPPNIQSRINTEKIEEVFGGLDMIMVVLHTDDVLNSETLGRVKKISRDLNRTKGVDKVLSLFDLKSIKGGDGMLIVDPAVKRIPKNVNQRETLRQEIKENDLVYEIAVSKDFKYISVIATISDGVEDEYLITKVEEILKENPGDEEIFIGGMPIVRMFIGKSAKRDMKKLLPIGLLIMVIFLGFAFKQARGVILPFTVVIMAIVVALGLIPLISWKMNMTSILLPIMLIAIANDYGIHLVAKFQEDNVESNNLNKNELAVLMFNSLWKPILITALTTVAGMLCLLGHRAIPAKQLGILASVGIAYALFASLLFIPAMTSLLKKPKPVLKTDSESKHFLDLLLHKFSQFVSAKPRAIVAASIIFSVLAGVGTFFLIIDANPENYYTKDHPIAVSTRILNNYFGGSQNVAIMISGDIKSPEIMKNINRYEQEIGKIPEIGNTTSIARAVRQMSRAINEKGDPFYDVIPEDRNAIAQYFELYNMSGDPDDFEKLVDFDYQNAQILARINDSATPKIKKVSKQILEMTKDDKSVKMVGGWGLIFKDLSGIFISGQVISLSLSILIVALLMMLMFRSVQAGLISAIPISLAMLILFGLMGYFRITLNVATAMLSSIMIGVGIDYTIHFLWRYKEELKNGLIYNKAIEKTLTTTGRGIIFNAFSVIIGFVVLMLSDFQPIKFYGFLVVISILSCLFGALILIPSLCLVLKPKFLEPK
jgi:uncharacterized protein